MDNILIEIKSSISKAMNMTPGDITLESKIEEDLEADSIDLYSIAIMLEEDLEVSITDEEVMSFKTVQDIYDLMKIKKA